MIYSNGKIKNSFLELVDTNGIIITNNIDGDAYDLAVIVNGVTLKYFIDDNQSYVKVYEYETDPTNEVQMYALMLTTLLNKHYKGVTSFDKTTLDLIAGKINATKSFMTTYKSFIDALN